jgi:hypothetical protein
VRIHAVIVYRRLTKLNHVLQLPSAEPTSQMAISPVDCAKPCSAGVRSGISPPSIE